MKRHQLEKSPGEFLCTTCDYDYGAEHPEEVAAHEAHHRRFLWARRVGLNPLPRAERDGLRTEGSRLTYDRSAPMDERVRGAKMWLSAKYHDHLAGALIHDAHLPGFIEFFDRRFLSDGLEQWFPAEIAAALREDDAP